MDSDELLRVLTGALRSFAEATADYGRLVDLVAQKVAEVVRDGCVVRLLSDGDWLSPVAVHYPFETHIDDAAAIALVRTHLTAPRRVSEFSIAARVLATGDAVLIPRADWRQVPQTTPEVAKAFETVGIHSLLVVALRVRGESIGVLSLIRFAPNSPPFNEGDRDLAQAIADHAALAITNAQLLRAARRELTERELAEANLRKAEEHLRRAQKMEAVGRLAGGIAHDFNNILMAIAGNNELAMNDLPPDHAALPKLHEIERASQRARDLVRRILAVSGREEVPCVVMSLRPVVEEALELLRVALPATAELRSELALDVPHVLADATQIHQVVMNLVTNAMSAVGPHKGAVEVRLDTVELGTDFVANTPDLSPGRYAVLTVRDTGCGMDEATLARIFDPFFTTKLLGRGTGLGLSLVDGIIRGYRGAVVVDSRPEQGATFRVYIPAAPHIAEPATPRKAPFKPLGCGERLLYVDDDQGLALLGKTMLGRLGYRAESCSNPEEALAQVRANPEAFDLVLTDLSMPGMSGHELARELLRVRAGLPIVLITGNISEEEIAAARAAGIRDVILKPCGLHAMSEIVGRVLAEERERQRALTSTG